MFQLFHRKRALFLFLALGLAMLSCKQPETVIIDSDPVSVTGEDTTREDTAGPSASSEFMQLNIGELKKIQSLDPLLAQTGSTMRTLQLVYEGLVRYDGEGRIVPGLAKNWSVSTDSLTYTFTLRKNLFYHDSEIFTNGLGRKVVSRDIRYIFERMASPKVPDRGAQLFMDIIGFEPYYREQHDLYHPVDRRLKTINGIKTPNDSTVAFMLTRKDPHFLQKLASPHALLYPREAVPSGQSRDFRAVGAGPFKFSQQEDSTTFIFSKFENYYDRSHPKINRLDLKIIKNESDLFQSFVRRDIDWIPEMGPQLLEGILNRSGNLKISYQNNYRLYRNTGGLSYRLKHNPNSDFPVHEAQGLGQVIDSTFTIYPKANLVNISLLHSGGDDLVLPDTTTFSFTEDPFTTWFLDKLNSKLRERGSVLQMHNIKTPTRNSGLFFTRQFSYFPSQNITADSNTIMELFFRHMALSQKNVKNITVNEFSWWANLRNTIISESE